MAAAAVARQRTAPKASIAPSSVVTILRIIIIIVFASFSGYCCVSDQIALSKLPLAGDASGGGSTFDLPSSTSVEVDVNAITDPMAKARAQAKAIFDEFGDSVATDAAPNAAQQEQEPLPVVVKRPRTWGAWLRSFLESSIWAIMIAHWIAGAMQPVIFAKLGVVETKTNFFSLATVMSIWTNGLDFIWEMIFSRFGEMAIHTVALMLSSVLFTLLLSDNSLNGPGTGNTDSGSGSTMNDAAAGDVGFGEL